MTTFEAIQTRQTITTKPGFLEKVDVGIAQYHFELGAGIEHDKWSV